MSTERKPLSQRIDDVVALMHGVDQESVLEPMRQELIALRSLYILGLFNQRGVNYVEKLVAMRERSFE